MDDGLSKVGAGVADGSKPGEMCDGREHGAVHQGQDGRTYEGQYRGGVPHGVGKEVEADGTTYDGEWSEGKKHGRGKQVLAEGTKYAGECKPSKKEGRGKVRSL